MASERILKELGTFIHIYTLYCRLYPKPLPNKTPIISGPVRRTPLRWESPSSVAGAPLTGGQFIAWGAIICLIPLSYILVPVQYGTLYVSVH